MGFCFNLYSIGNSGSFSGSWFGSKELNLSSNSAMRLSYSASFALISFSLLLKAANLREKSSLFSGSLASSNDVQLPQTHLSQNLGSLQHHLDVHVCSPFWLL